MTERARDEIPVEDRWNLEALYTDDEAWEERFAAAKALPEELLVYKGTLHESPQVLRKALDAYFSAMRQLEKVYTYAHLRHDEDLTQSSYHAFYERARNLYHQFDTATAYLSPELLQMDAETLGAWLDEEELAPYRIFLRDLLRQKPHTLSQAEERILAMAAEPLSATGQIFSMLNNVDIPSRLGKVETEEGERVKLTHATYYKLMESRNRKLRREAFHTFYEGFRSNRNTLAASLDGQIKNHVFQARVRNYDSARQAALFADNVSTDVYDGLIDTIHKGLPDFFRYLGLRKKALGLDDLHIYDQSVPIVSDVDLSYTWKEAEELVFESLRPLGDEYLDILQQGFADRWVDRYENKGKRSGAYSSGCYDSMPYILHNYNGTLNSVFTLTHELGHSMHSALTNANQSYQTSHYRIFVAEVASTTNEALLLHHMLEHTSDPKIRAYLINHHINDFRTTMFRQTMFAEFERDIHHIVESGEGVLSAEFMDERYLALVKSYFGDQLAWDDEDAPIAWEWARIPHFYYNFYVYKYATGMAAATSLAQQILEEGAPAVERYLRFLKAGSSRYPLELLQDAGVDLTTPQPIEAALTQFSSLIDELEKLLDP